MLNLTKMELKENPLRKVVGKSTTEQRAPIKTLDFETDVKPLEFRIEELITKFNGSMGLDAGCSGCGNCSNE